jgi:hypothetical protein
MKIFRWIRRTKKSEPIRGDKMNEPVLSEGSEKRTHFDNSNHPPEPPAPPAPQPVNIMLHKFLPITNEQMEGLLKAIPAGWTLTFFRHVLRPDLLEMTVSRSDHVHLKVKTTGNKLLENKKRDFMNLICSVIGELKAAKRK